MPRLVYGLAEKNKMYNNNNRNNSRGGYRGGRNYGRRRSSFKIPKALDPQRLIKKAVIKNTSVEETKATSFNFNELEINPNLKNNVLEKGFINPTPIQEQAIPIIMEGKDLVGIANTGTGKTGAFLIPIIEQISKNRAKKALIIAPTRELADQIEQDAYLLTKNLNIYTALLVGGVYIGKQIGRLRTNPHIVVGTPGRILDIVNRKAINLNQFNIVVLDEIDRMLDMGFIGDIKEIIGNLSTERQSLFFSATMDNNAEKLLNLFSHNYETVSVKTSSTSENVHQDIIPFRGKDDKDAKLAELLKTEEFKKTLIFVRTKHEVEKLEKRLADKGFRVTSLHGNKSQGQRKRSLDAFKKSIVNVLVATDVVARGIDIKDITHVINYDMPDSYETYSHRIGRTGRADNIGYAFTFVEG